MFFPFKRGAQEPGKRGGNPPKSSEPLKTQHVTFHHPNRRASLLFSAAQAINGELAPAEKAGGRLDGAPELLWCFIAGFNLECLGTASLGH